MRNTTITILLMLVSLISYSQDTLRSEEERLPAEKIFLTGKNTGEKIILRWVPGSPGAWHLSNQAGYMVERLAFRDTTDFGSSQYQGLTPEPLKPWPLENWELIANEASGDKYAAIAAQAIWGKRNKSDVLNTEADIFEKAREFENLFSLAMLAAEYSANAATASALRFEDEDIDPAMTYFYRVYSLGSSSEYPIDTAYLVLNGADVDHPFPINIEVLEENENEIIVGWDRLYENEYSSWFIERSSDGGAHFTRLNKDPYIDSNIDDMDVKEQFIYYKDSVAQNYIRYSYRVVGINTYAEYSEPSNLVSGMGRDKTPPFAPQNINAEETETGKMLISWDMPVVSKDLEGFLISRSNQVDAGEVALTPELLPKETRNFIDSSFDPIQNNWYFVYAVDTAGNAIVGIPEYGSIVDSIPPEMPTGLEGRIDSNGIVKITWDPGKERDLYGYVVYSANQDDHIYINLTNHAIRDTVFTDTLSLDVLTEEIYYKIAALDYARNQSDFSNVIQLIKPDIIPPVSPVFTDYKVTEDGIILNWAMSSSHDVQTHLLYRKIQDSTDWVLVYETNELKDSDQFLDAELEDGLYYEYKLLAKDDDGLFSEESGSLLLRAIDFSSVVPVSKLSGKLDKKNNEIEVYWEYPEMKNCQFLIFRAINGGSFYMLTKTDSENRRIIDTDISPGRKYEYAIKVLMNTNKESEFSPIAIVEIPKKR